jgi:hypothetical protein
MQVNHSFPSLTKHLLAIAHFINLTCFRQFCSLSEVLEIKLKFQTAINSLCWHIDGI